MEDGQLHQRIGNPRVLILKSTSAPSWLTTSVEERKIDGRMEREEREREEGREVSFVRPFVRPLSPSRSILLPLLVSHSPLLTDCKSFRFNLFVSYPEKLFFLGEKMGVRCFFSSVHSPFELALSFFESTFVHLPPTPSFSPSPSPPTSLFPSFPSLS